MKLARVMVSPMLLLFASPLLLAQKLEPTSLAFEAVPGYSSSPQSVAFTNTGDSEVTLTISVSGFPFAIYENRCGHGVKPGTHCNVYVIYTPQAIETDTGTLGFAFSGQTVSVPLTGNAVSIVPTKFTHVAYSSGSDAVKVTLYAEGDIIPAGEQVELHCIDYEGVNEVTDWGTLENNKATIAFTGATDDWQCSVGYDGDPEFAASVKGLWINQCHPVDSCHDNGDALKETP